MNLSNYSIKRMIPRLIIAAILVNASFYIAAFAVDVSNLLGYNIMKLFGAIDIGATGVEGFQSGWQEVIGFVLVGVAGVGLIVAIILAPTVLLAFGLVIMILIARKALVVLLIVLAPIAFVAYLLPNTEDWFKKWYKAFVALLMVFPVISLVFGGSLLASNVLIGVAENSAGDGDDTQNMLYIVALATAAIPLFAVPTLLKSSLAAAGSVGQKIAGLQDRTNRYAGKKAMEGRIGEAKMAFKSRQQANRVNRRLKGGYIGKGRVGQYMARKGAERAAANKRGGKTLQMLGAPGKQVDNSRFARTLGADRGAAAATAAYNKEAREETERQEQTMSSTPISELQAMVENESLSDERRSAAARTIAQRGGDKEVHKMIDYITRAKKKAAGPNGNKRENSALENIQQLSAGDVLKRNIGGWGSTMKNNYASGSAESDGYLKDLVGKLRDGSMGAEGLSKLGIDDHIRLAQLSKDGKLGPNDRAMIAGYLTDIDNSDTMKIDDRARNVINQTISGTGRGPGGKIIGLDNKELELNSESVKLEYDNP